MYPAGPEPTIIHVAVCGHDAAAWSSECEGRSFETTNWGTVPAGERQQSSHHHARTVRQQPVGGAVVRRWRDRKNGQFVMYRG